MPQGESKCQSVTRKHLWHESNTFFFLPQVHSSFLYHFLIIIFSNYCMMDVDDGPTTFKWVAALTIFLECCFGHPKWWTIYDREWQLHGYWPIFPCFSLDNSNYFSADNLQDWIKLFEHQKTAATAAGCLVYIANALSLSEKSSVTVQVGVIFLFIVDSL